jgi:hypothetical protein
MKSTIFTALALLSFMQMQGKGIKHNIQPNTLPDIELLKGTKFVLEYQVFQSHDQTGTDIDTVRNDGDYILFSATGEAYMNYKEQLDSIQYAFPNKESVSFGDAPFTITNLGHGLVKLSQNEKESNGDYNSVVYFLKKEDRS